MTRAGQICTPCIYRVGQNHIYTPYITVHLVISLPKISYIHPGGVKDHNSLTSRVNRNINCIFGILTSRAIDWYLNESLLRGSKGGGGPWGVGEFGGVF